MWGRSLRTHLRLRCRARVEGHVAAPRGLRNAGTRCWTKRVHADAPIDGRNVETCPSSFVSYSESSERWECCSASRGSCSTMMQTTLKCARRKHEIPRGCINPLTSDPPTCTTNPLSPYNGVPQIYGRGHLIVCSFVNGLARFGLTSPQWRPSYVFPSFGAPSARTTFHITKRPFFELKQNYFHLSPIEP